MVGRCQVVIVEVACQSQLSSVVVWYVVKECVRVCRLLCECVGMDVRVCRCLGLCACFAFRCCCHQGDVFCAWNESGRGRVSCRIFPTVPKIQTRRAAPTPRMYTVNWVSGVSGPPFPTSYNGNEHIASKILATESDFYKSRFQQSLP